MKKLTLAAALAASAFAMGANAGTTSANLNITGKVVPAACTISTGAAGGTIDFGTIQSSELESSKLRKSESSTLSIACQSTTTALVKVTGSNGAADDGIFFKTDQDFASYMVQVKNLQVTEGNSMNYPTVTADPNAEVDMAHLSDTTFRQQGTAGAAFPMHGKYFGAAAKEGGLGTFKTLNAELQVTAVIDSQKAKDAVKEGEKTFSSMVTFELNYL
ncbi:fimbrial protein [Cronobacter malonaticus]